MNRTMRLLEIRRLIKDNKIGNQEELLVMLNKNGFKYTQATLSRDLKVLRVGKVADEEKGSIYVLPGRRENENNSNGPGDAVSSGILSIDYSGNMAVMKTLPGFASGIALRIDGMKAFEILGTIAGDDTILVIARDGITRQDLHRVLTMAIPDGINISHAGGADRQVPSGA
jgi:transcriptional regulator of arginine metabolism